MRLRIREKQMKVLEDAALRRFEDEMVEHSKKFTPKLCEVLGEEQLRAGVVVNCRAMVLRIADIQTNVNFIDASFFALACSGLAYHFEVSINDGRPRY